MGSVFMSNFCLGFDSDEDARVFLGISSQMNRNQKQIEVKQLADRQYSVKAMKEDAGAAGILYRKYHRNLIRKPNILG